MMVHLGDRRRFGGTKEIQSGVARAICFLVWPFMKTRFTSQPPMEGLHGHAEIASTPSLQPETASRRRRRPSPLGDKRHGLWDAECQIAGAFLTTAGVDDCVQSSIWRSLLRSFRPLPGSACDGMITVV